jgi:guanine deaminase
VPPAEGVPGAATTIVRGRIAHAPGDPWTDDDALETFDDGGLAYAGIRIVDLGDFTAVRRRHPRAAVRDTGGALVIPGLVDAHVHYPQLGVIGTMGLELLEWLDRRTLPLEARMHDCEHAEREARTFLRTLVANGTTSALVFGSHIPDAQDALFTEADRVGIRIASGLVVSDRRLRDDLHRSPHQAFEEGAALADRWHGVRRIRYAVTPRFSLSCSDGMLEACGALLRRAPGLLVTSHLNESPAEIAEVRRLFPWARDYLDTYERFGLVGARSVFAHSVHSSDEELKRLASARACVAHCPSSNAMLGSGIIRLARHLRHGVTVALGSDVGAGPRPSILEEALAAYQLQMLGSDRGARLSPAKLLYLATRAGARALDLDAVVGAFTPGREADFVVLCPPAGSTLAATVERSESWDGLLGAFLALAREDAVAEVHIGGELVRSGKRLDNT